MPAHLHESGASRPAGVAVPGRPSAAKLTSTFAKAAADRLPRSLRTRLPILIALVVAVVLTSATLAEVWSVGRAVERNLVETAERTARAVVEDLAARKSGFDPADVRDTLHELIEANSVLQSISIVDVEPSDTQVVASTSSEEREESLALGGQAVAAGVPQFDRRRDLTVVALPLAKDGRQLAVVAAVSMASVGQIEAQGRMVLLWVALPSILIVTVLIDMVMRRLIHNPIGELRYTIRRVSDGDLSSRVAVLRDDELGTVATGLNDMLRRLDHASEALQQRVSEATSELVVRNSELEESYQRVLALREALTRAERMAAVGQMAASVAHQVGTPLNLVSGYVQMIRENRQTDPLVRERLQIVETQLTQITNVLRTMLDRARQPSPRVPLEVAKLVEGVCAIAKPRLSRSGIRLDVVVEESVGSVRADAAQLELALFSLMTNAIDAMPTGGTLRISAASRPSGVRIEVADTGHGIPRDLLPRLFEPFVTTKPEGHGTGLGLGIVREVIRTHGGEISVTSEPGTGTVFAIDLPSTSISEAAALRGRAN